MAALALKVRIHEDFVATKDKYGFRGIWKMVTELLNENENLLGNGEYLGYSKPRSAYGNAKRLLKSCRGGSPPRWNDGQWKSFIYDLLMENNELEEFIATEERKNNTTRGGKSTMADSLKIEQNVITAVTTDSGNDKSRETAGASVEAGPEVMVEDDEPSNAIDTPEYEVTAVETSDANDGETSAEEEAVEEDEGEAIVEPVPRPEVEGAASVEGLAAQVGDSARASEKEDDDVLHAPGSALGLVTVLASAPLSNVACVERPHVADGSNMSVDGRMAQEQKSNMSAGIREQECFPPFSYGGTMMEKQIHANIDFAADVGSSKFDCQNDVKGSNVGKDMGTLLSNGGSEKENDLANGNTIKLADGFKNSNGPPNAGPPNVSNFGPTKEQINGKNNSWAGLFQSNPKSELKLQYIEPGESKGKNILKMPKQAGKNASNWSSCLVGYFLEGKLSFPQVHYHAYRNWGKLGLKEVLVNDDGFVFFRFDSIKSSESVLESGPWPFDGQPVILKKWSKNLKLGKETFEKFPIWVKIYNLPLEYWCEEGLSRVASMLGKPLYVDKMTESCKRISYARICIEIDIHSELVSDFLLEVEDDDGNVDTIKINIEYHRKPKKCMKCQCFGHNCEAKPMEKQQNPNPMPREVNRGPLKHTERHPRDRFPNRMGGFQEWQTVHSKNKGKGKAQASMPFPEPDLAKASSSHCHTNQFGVLEIMEDLEGDKAPEVASAPKLSEYELQISTAAREEELERRLFDGLPILPSNLGDTLEEECESLDEVERLPRDARLEDFFVDPPASYGSKKKLKKKK